MSISLILTPFDHFQCPVLTLTHSLILILLSRICIFVYCEPPWLEEMSSCFSLLWWFNIPAPPPLHPHHHPLPFYLGGKKQNSASVRITRFVRFNRIARLTKITRSGAQFTMSGLFYFFVFLVSYHKVGPGCIKWLPWQGAHSCLRGFIWLVANALLSKIRQMLRFRVFFRVKMCPLKTQCDFFVFVKSLNVPPEIRFNPVSNVPL